MTVTQAIVIVSAGLIAGIVNAMAGGGSLLTVALLTIFGDLPGLVANGTNRIGVAVQNIASVAGYRRGGISGLSRAIPVLIPIIIGSIFGSLVVSSLTSESFERVFGVLMLPILFLSLRPPKVSSVEITWRPVTTYVVFFAIGIYGGAFQAGVGLILVVALARSGLDLVNANAVKVFVILVLTFFALPVFIIRNQVDWGFAAVLALGFALGGWIGARLAVRGGDKAIRPVLIISVVALALRMIGVF